MFIKVIITVSFNIHKNKRYLITLLSSFIYLKIFNMNSLDNNQLN